MSVPAGLATGLMMFPLYLLVLISTRPGSLLLVVAALLLAHPLAATAMIAAAAEAASSRPRWRRVNWVSWVSKVIGSRSRRADVPLRVLG